MIVVDKENYSSDAFRKRANDLYHIKELASPEGKVFALCLKHPFDILSTVSYLVDKGAGVLLLHAETPYASAVDIGKQTGCYALIHSEWTNITLICGSARVEEPTLYQFSSGTTGNPKLIGRSWNEIEEEIRTYNQHHNWGADEQPLVLVPISHSFGLISGTYSALRRETVPIIVMDKNPKYALHLIQTTKKTIVFGGPFHFHILSSISSGEPIRFHKSVSSGSYLPDHIFEKLSQNSEELWQQYGCSEVGCISLGTNLESGSHVGKVLPHLNIHIEQLERNDYIDHVETTSGEAGEIVVSNKGKRINTNDVGKFSLNGSLCVFGRSDDIINVAGFLVYPSEIENVIMKLGGVREAVVFGVNHKLYGETIKAMVVAEENLSAKEIRLWCMNWLPKFKTPTEVVVVEHIPKTGTGKISRKLLRKLG